MLAAGGVSAIRQLAMRRKGIRAIARELGVACNTVRRYLRQPIEPGLQSRPTARRVAGRWLRDAQELFASGPAAGNAALVQRVLEGQGLIASERTVQRVLAGRRCAPGTDVMVAPGEIPRWERDLPKQVARSVRTHDHDELESDLTLHLAALQRRSREHILNWRAFLVTALTRKARNWLRDRRRIDGRTESLNVEGPTEGEGDRRPRHHIADAERPVDDQIALEKALAELSPDLREIARLLEELGSQARVAEHLGVHRNTVSEAVRRIREVLKLHGF